MNNDNFVPENDPDNQVNINPEIAQRIRANYDFLKNNMYSIWLSDLPVNITRQTDTIRRDVLEIDSSHDWQALEFVYDQLQAVKIECAKRGFDALRYVVLAEYHCMEILADVIRVKPIDNPPSYGNISWVNGGES